MNIEKAIRKKVGLYFNIDKSSKVIKMEDEPYTYRLESIVMYAFEKEEITRFLHWYYFAFNSSFLFDLACADEKVMWNYFASNIPEFKTKYPKVEDYENLFSGENWEFEAQLFTEQIGFDNLIQFLIESKQLKKMNFRVSSGFYVKFAEINGRKRYYEELPA